MNVTWLVEGRLQRTQLVGPTQDTNKQRASLVASLSRSSGEMAATNFFASFPLNSLRGPLCAGEAFWGTRIRIRSPLGGVSLTPLAH